MEFLPARRHVSCTAHRADGSIDGTCCVPEETPVAISFNGASYAVMMATPADLEDFAVGFALSEGIVSSAGEVLGLNVVSVDGGVDCQVELADDASERLKARRRRIAGPVGCGLCGIESITEAVRPVPRLEAADTRFSGTDITQAVHRLAAAQPLHRETSAVHAAGFYLSDSGVIAVREDIGRHNALDKLVGVLSLRGVDASKGAIVITSRVSVEMVQKTAVAGAPVLIAVSAPTALAVRTAEVAGMTLVARVRSRDFDVFTHPHRVSGQERADVA